MPLVRKGADLAVFAEQVESLQLTVDSSLSNASN